MKTVILAALAVLLAVSSAAQGYPTRTIRVITNVSAGGTYDIFIRALASELHKRGGKPVIVEPRPGGNFLIGGRACAEAPADGYSICALSQESLYADLLNHTVPYDPRRDFVPITNLFFNTQALVVNSASFWRSECTGLKGYRLAAYDELPRTGMPELFGSIHDYDAYVSALVGSGAIPDASHVWWAIRPSDKYPTLELRATDCCTRVDDAIALAALYRCFVRHLYRRPSVNADLDQVDRAIAVENKWLAQRYGVDASFVSPAGPVSVTEMLEDTLDRIRGDADVLGCWNDVLHCRRIVSGGSSADTQLRVYAQAKAINDADGLYPVLRWIADASFA